MKFGHIGIKVLDMEKSVQFYEKILEAKVIKDYVYPDSHLVFLEIGGTIVELIYKKENSERNFGPIDHIAFKVDSLEEKQKLLAAYGIAHSESMVVGSARILFFEGPNHERFEFVTRA